MGFAEGGEGESSYLDFVAFFFCLVFCEADGYYFGVVEDDEGDYSVVEVAGEACDCFCCYFCFSACFVCEHGLTDDVSDGKDVVL